MDMQNMIGDISSFANQEEIIDNHLEVNSSHGNFKSNHNPHGKPPTVVTSDGIMQKPLLMPFIITNKLIGVGFIGDSYTWRRDGVRK